MNNLQIPPQFTEIQLGDSENFSQNFKQNCAYLLPENDFLSNFIENIGKKYSAEKTAFNLYDFYAAYNLNFPTTPATVSLINKKRSLAIGVNNFAELLEKILQNQQSESQTAVFLSVEGREPAEMLKLKREILQQFIFLRMYMPIIIAENFQVARNILSVLERSEPVEKTEITFLGTKKAGKSSLINAILGAEYSPSSSELPTPNKVTYTSGSGNLIRFESENFKKTFQTPSELREHLASEFRRANKNSSALEPMKIFLPNFPADLKNFAIVDTPGPNFAGAKESHAQVTADAMKEMQRGIFVMNYSAHLTFNEMELFEKTYKIFNNKRRHQTLIVAVNRIDEMYAADEIKSYERFADYIKRRLNAHGYDNFVVISISAITAVYVEKIRRFLKNFSGKLADALEELAETADEENLTVIDFVENSLSRMKRFHGLKIDSLDALKDTSRVSFLKQVAESIYNPAESFDWIDETFEDVFEEDFASDEEFFRRVLSFAEQGDSDAMNFVGMLHERGLGTAKNLEKSFEWFKKSAELGHPAGMFNLARSYHNGRGVEKNLAEAVKWLKKSADSGDLPAITALADSYRDGDGVEKNLSRAFELYKKAAEQGEVDAMVSLAAMYFHGEGTEKDLKKSFEWDMKAAELDDVVAIKNVAYCYRYGEGVAKNIHKAIEYYEKVATEDPDAMNELAEIYFFGEGITEDKRKGFELFKLAADAGQTDAMLRLGNCYFRGEGTEQNYAQSTQWYRKSADKGNGWAMNNLANNYRYGNGVKQDLTTAVIYYRKAVDAGINSALEELGDVYNELNNFSDAFNCYKKSAENGSVHSMFMLAIAYYRGEGTAKDYYAAFNWFKTAAKNDHYIAMNWLGSMYRDGEGCYKDNFEAFQWFKKSAEAGNEYAMRNLAYCYANGEGTPKNFSDAVYWLEKAIDAGLTDVAEDLAELYDANDYSAKAFKYYKLAAENGSVYSMFEVALAYYRGEGCNQDYYAAFNWFKKAAKNGHVNAMNWLGSMYLDGEGCYKDNFEAFRWFRKSAEGGNEYAMNSLGNLYYSGEGCQQDYAQSTHWYRKAAEKGSGWGMYNLANNYRNGRGTQKDLNQAATWYKKAADAGIEDALNALGNTYYDLENYSEAVKWYRKASEAGDDWGTHNLGYCYYHGKGVQESNREAFNLFEQAANKGNSSSMAFLGHMYRYGYYVSQNRATARNWYEKAIRAGNKDAQKSMDELNDEIRRENSSSSGGCFITSAVCDSFGKADDCYELTTFRNFRDGWLTNQPDGKNLIAEYYEVAPKIVAKINALSNSAEIYKNIWRDYLSDCLKSIERGDYQKCKKTYVKMVRDLTRYVK